MADFQDNLEVMNQFFGLNNKEKQKKIMFARKDKKKIGDARPGGGGRCDGKDLGEDFDHVSEGVEGMFIEILTH